MDRGPAQYSPSCPMFTEESSAVQVAATQYQPAWPYNLSTSAIPMSEYGLIPPPERSGSFPEVPIPQGQPSLYALQPHNMTQVYPGHPQNWRPHVVQQHKATRRHGNEIERMFKCRWDGCSKAYGTPNHLNTHVKSQSHGQKLTPEESREIRRKWKEERRQKNISVRPQLPPIGYQRAEAGQEYYQMLQDVNRPEYPCVSLPIQ